MLIVHVRHLCSYIHSISVHLQAWHLIEYVLSCKTLAIRSGTLRSVSLFNIKFRPALIHSLMLLKTEVLKLLASCRNVSLGPDYYSGP